MSEGVKTNDPAFRTLQNIVWPAVAGNVLWAVVSLTVKTVAPWKAPTANFSAKILCEWIFQFGPDELLRLFCLLFAGVYLISQWRETERLSATSVADFSFKKGFVFADYCLAGAIAFLPSRRRRELRGLQSA